MSRLKNVTLLEEDGVVIFLMRNDRALSISMEVGQKW